MREYAAKEGVEAEKALAVGMAEKAKEFTETGSEIYHGNLPDGAKEHHQNFASNMISIRPAVENDI